MAELNYILDGYQLRLLPGPGGYSGYNPVKRRTDVKTLSGNVSLDFGSIVGDNIITIAGAYTDKAEFLSIQGRYQSKDADGTSRRMNWKEVRFDGVVLATYEVEVVELAGAPYKAGVADLYQNVALTMKVLSVGP